MSLVDLGKKLLESARIGETDDVRLLMSNGAPFTTDWLGASPLHLASQHGHLETVAVLIRAGICRDARTKLDRTSLHLASQEGQVQIVELLLKSGADIEAKDMLKMTPLHWAVEREHLPTVEILLRHNADVNVKNKFDKTPLDISFDNNQTEIYELLQKYAVLKENELLKSDKLDLDHLPSSDSTEIVTTSFVEVNKSSKHSFHNLKSKSPKKYITVPKLSPEENDEIKRSVSSLKLIQKGCSDNESNDLQTSTSVLDTLAALAEATASKSDTSIEGANWLEENGITMLPVDNSTVVTSALEGGQSLTLTEAGKLALNWTKSKPNGRDISTNSSTNEKVITIVADQSQIPSIVGSSNQGTPILLMNTDGSETVTFTNTDEISNPVKRPRLARKISLKSPKILESKEDILSEKEKLQRELEETRKMAEEYKAKLIKKENEAEEYKKKLDEISSPK